jgi:SOS-response transcriptional repressor LexA
MAQFQLDTRIPLGVQPEQSSGTGGPLRTLGQLTQLQEMRGLNRQRDLASQQRQRELEDDDAMREALSSSATPDDAITALYRQGRARVAGGLSKQVAEQRKSQSDQLKVDLDNSDRALTLVTNMLDGVTDTQGLGTVRENAAKIAPGLVKYIPAEFDPEEIKRVTDLGRKQSEYLKLTGLALENDNKAQTMKLAAQKGLDEHLEALRGAEAYQRKAASQLLATTQSQADLDGKQRLLANRGYSDSVLAEFGNEWTPAYGARARQLGMTSTEQASTDNAAANTALRGREVKVREKELQDRESAAANGTPAVSRPITPTAASAVKRAKKREFDDFEKDIRTPNAANANEIPLYTRMATGDPAARAEVAQQKLDIENDARDQMGQPSIEAAERQYAETPGAEAKLRQLRAYYRKLTGDDTPMEKIEKLFKAVNAEQDPEKKKALRQQLAEARKAADAAAGR